MGTRGCVLEQSGAGWRGHTSRPRDTGPFLAGPQTLRGGQKEKVVTAGDVSTACVVGSPPGRWSTDDFLQCHQKTPTVCNLFRHFSWFFFVCFFCFFFNASQCNFEETRFLSFRSVISNRCAARACQTCSACLRSRGTASSIPERKNDNSQHNNSCPCEEIKIITIFCQIAKKYIFWCATEF